MKTFLKIFIVLITLISLSSCTANQRTRQFGGEMTIELPKGQKLVLATWKESNLFYLLEPMDSDYMPKHKVFIESSSWGIFESKIIFIESK